jgi:hypothetical protein
LYGGLPRDPQIPWSVRLWKGPLKWLGNMAIVGGIVGMALHYMRFGPKKEEPIPSDGSPNVSQNNVSHNDDRRDQGRRS